MGWIVVGISAVRYGPSVGKNLLVHVVRVALRLARPGAAPEAGVRARVLSAAARVVAPMHPTNASGNNRSMR